MSQRSFKSKPYTFVGKSKVSSRAVGHLRLPDGEIVTVVNGRTYSKAKITANKKIGEIVRREHRERA